jgi:nucleotide-binding universal stress UspA family protein
MLPVKKIICPTDFSEASKEGLRAAEELARHFGADLFLVHVIAPLPTIPGASAPTGFHIPSVLKEIQASAMKMLEHLIKRDVSMRVRVEPVVLQGDPAREIVRVAEERSADLIIIASHGESGWQRFVSGSVAEKVVRLATCPVLTVHPQRKR